jgi:hypothetical protein
MKRGEQRTQVLVVSQILGQAQGFTTPEGSVTVLLLVPILIPHALDCLCDKVCLSTQLNNMCLHFGNCLYHGISCRIFPTSQKVPSYPFPVDRTIMSPFINQRPFYSQTSLEKLPRTAPPLNKTSPTPRQAPPKLRPHQGPLCMPTSYLPSSVKGHAWGP